MATDDDLNLPELPDEYFWRVKETGDTFTCISLMREGLFFPRTVGKTYVFATGGARMIRTGAALLLEKKQHTIGLGDAPIKFSGDYGRKVDKPDTL